MDYDYKFKVAIVGDSCVGKSSLLYREVYNDFLNIYEPTVAVGFSSKNIKYNNNIVKLNVWDLSGDDRYRTVLKSYLKHVDLILLVYDVTNINSFNNIKEWVTFVESSQIINPIYILLANKIDCDKRVVDVDIGIQYALKNKMIYLDVSAKTGKTMNFLNMISEVLMEKKYNETSLNKNIKNNITVQKINEFLENEEMYDDNKNKNEDNGVRWCSCDIF